MNLNRRLGRSKKDPERGWRPPSDNADCERTIAVTRQFRVGNWQTIGWRQAAKFISPHPTTTGSLLVVAILVHHRFATFEIHGTTYLQGFHAIKSKNQFISIILWRKWRLSDDGKFWEDSTCLRPPLNRFFYIMSSGQGQVMAKVITWNLIYQLYQLRVCISTYLRSPLSSCLRNSKQFEFAPLNFSSVLITTAAEPSPWPMVTKRARAGQRTASFGRQVHSKWKQAITRTLTWPAVAK